MAKAAQKTTPELNINLLPGDEPSGTLGTATHWALTVGRYLIIITEIIAIAIFVLSIKLATDKQGLKEDIQSLGSRISAESKFETEFRLVQQRINEVKSQRNAHFQNNLAITDFLKLLPKGMTLQALKIGDQEISFDGSFKSPKQLQTLISAFSKSEKLVGLDIEELKSPSEKSKNYTFSAKALIVQASFEEEAGNATN
jgi:predicted nucleic acid-binding protein